MWQKSNGTGRPADMAEDPQTIETHDINLQQIAMVRAKWHPATAIALLSRAPFGSDVLRGVHTAMSACGWWGGALSVGGGHSSEALEQCGVVQLRPVWTTVHARLQIRMSIKTANLKHVHSIFFCNGDKACDEFSIAILRRTKICNFNTFFSKLCQS